MADIISNLSSLQFECCLTDDELKLVHLRTLTHALAVTACAHATYLVSLIRDARLIAARCTKIDATADGDEDGLSDNVCRFTVGIIGCGRIGRHVANSLLTFGEVAPEDLKISTRRPELLADMAKDGVLCTYDNAGVAKSVSLLFICCLPSQLPTVAMDIQDILSTETLVFSIVSASPLPKLKQLLGTSNILHPEISTTADGDGQNWNIKTDIVSALGVPDIVEKTCPLSLSKQQSVVVTSDHFADLLTYAVANSLAGTSLTPRQKLSVINALVLGHTRQRRLSHIFTLEDFHSGFDQLSDVQYDLVSLAKMDSTPVGQRLRRRAVKEAFVSRYCDVFHQHTRWTIKDGTNRKHLDVVTD